MALIDEEDEVIAVKEPSGFTKLVGEVAASYFGAQRTNGPAEIGQVIEAIAEALSKLDSPKEAPKPAAEPEVSHRLTPAAIRKLVHDDGIVSPIDGKKYRSLKRHITTNGLTVPTFLEKFGLDKTFPLVAPAYSRQRSELAKTLGLGNRGRGAAPAAKAAPKAKAPRKAAAPPAE